MLLRTLIGVPENSQRISIDGVDLAVAVTGQGPSIVCLHASGHGGADFDALTAALQDRFQIIRIDWPGQGRSGADTQPATPARYAQLLDGIMTRLGIRDPVIIGCSIGGAAAIHYAAQHPVKALVLCNTGGLVPVTTVVKLFCSAFARFFQAGSKGRHWYAGTFSFYYRRLVLPSPAAAQQRQRIIAASYELAPVLASAWTHFGQADADIRALALALDVPVWFAWARHDRIIPLSRCLPTVRAMKHASLTKFDGGHAAFLEQPEAFITELERYLKAIGV